MSVSFSFSFFVSFSLSFFVSISLSFFVSFSLSIPYLFLLCISSPLYPPGSSRSLSSYLTLCAPLHPIFTLFFLTFSLSDYLPFSSYLHNFPTRYFPLQLCPLSWNNSSSCFFAYLSTPPPPLTSPSLLYVFSLTLPLHLTPLIVYPFPPSLSLSSTN